VHPVGSYCTEENM